MTGTEEGTVRKRGTALWARYMFEELRWFHFLPAWGRSPSKLALAMESG